MVRVLWARHGITEENKQKRYIGHTDALLSDEGVKQCRMLAKRLQHTTIEAIYTSDLRRTKDTAHWIANKRTDVPVSSTPLLRELFFGAWENKTYDEIKREDHAQLHKFYDNPWMYAPRNGEALAEMQKRLDEFLTQRIRTHHREHTVLVVTHGGFIRLFHALYIAKETNAHWNFSLPHGELLCTTYDHEHGSWQICRCPE